MVSRSDETPTVANILLLVGPSGCGKTRLATLTGLPTVPLDDFYRDGREPDMPRIATGPIDWEDPRSWDPDAAVRALEQICRDGAADVPIYSFAEDRAVGHRTISRGDSPLIVAEGIFAAEIIPELRARGLLADALLIRQNRWITFARRLGRDLADGRKNRRRLISQGWEKTRSEAAVVARQRACGARPVTKAAALERAVGLCPAVPGASAVGRS